MGKSAIKRAVEVMEQRNTLIIPDSKNFDVWEFFTEIELTSDSNGKRPINVKCLLDTGSNFFITLPVSWKKKIGPVTMAPELDNGAVGLDETKTKAIAFRCRVKLADVWLNCVCHFLEGTDQPIVGTRVLVEYFDLHVIDGQLVIKPNQKKLSALKRN